jgi:CHAT domain-containing protein
MTGRAILGVLLLGLVTCRSWRSTSCEQVNERMRRLESRPGRLDEALRRAAAFLDSPQAEPQSACYWNLYLHRADVVLEKKSPERALALLERPIPKAISTPELEARREMLQGWAQYHLSKYQEALRLLDAAYALAAANSPSVVPAIELRRAPVRAMLHDDAGANRSLENAAEFAARLGDTSLQVYVYGTRVYNLQQVGRFEKAAEWSEKALALAEAQDDQAQVAKALVNLGLCYQELGELEKSRALLNRALAINRLLEADGEELICLLNLGNIYSDWGDYPKATASFSQALELARRRKDSESVAMLLSNLAGVSIETRDWTAAQNYNDEALKLKRELKQKDAELISLVNAARIENGRGDRIRAEKIFNDVLQARSDNPRPNIGAHAGLAKLYRDSGDLPKAEAEFEAALAVIDEARAELIKDSNKLSYGSNLTEVESSYVSLLMQEHKTEQALEVTELRRARLLNERQGADKQHRPLTGADYRRLARDSGRVLISYYLGPERSFVWVVSPDRIEARTLAGEATIKQLAEGYRALIEDQENPLDSDSHLGENLYRELIAPVGGLIRQGQRVVIVPHGSLHALNMETLIAPSPAPHYWGDDVIVSVAPSLNALSAGAEHNARPPSLLLIGDPIPVSRDYPKLLFAAKEIEAVQQYFDPGRTRIFRNGQAVRAAYLNSHPETFSVIHFTAHGTADRESPLESAIILSESEAKYRLTANDVLRGAKLRADLVVISACRSAGARTYDSEGLVGFTWTFFRAGARNVIAGLWDVDDESTPQLMDQLYRALARHVAPDLALRAAKLSLSHSSSRNRAPYYWASFQLYARRLN